MTVQISLLVTGGLILGFFTLYFFFKLISNNFKRKLPLSIQLFAYLTLTYLPYQVFEMFLNETQKAHLLSYYASKTQEIITGIIILICVIVFFTILFAKFFIAEIAKSDNNLRFKSKVLFVSILLNILMILKIIVTNPLSNINCQTKTRTHKQCENFVWYLDHDSNGQKSYCYKKIFRKYCPKVNLSMRP